jgi:hypothetical protein
MTEDSFERSDSTDTIPDAVAGAFARHEAFTATGEGDGSAGTEGSFALESTAFDVRATASAVASERAGRFRLVVTVPTLSACVTDPSAVADVVEDGWFETLERRLGDAYDVAKTSVEGEPTLDRGAESVRVAFAFEPWQADTGVSDAKALAEYVEGTFLQGLIPGYEYVGVAAELQAAATQTTSDGDRDGSDDAPSRGGTPL